MSTDRYNPELFTPGSSLDAAPAGDLERQAVDALRGYAYQIAASTLAWLDLEPTDCLYLEVAEDYATVAGNTLNAVQVKDTAASGSVTLNTDSVRDAIHAFVDLVSRNPARAVTLRYLTTAPIGLERDLADRPAGRAGLTYWREAARGADIEPLRAILEGPRFSEPVWEFVRARDGDALRKDLLRKIHWDCGQPDVNAVSRELEERLTVFGRERFQLPAPEVQRLANVLMHHVLKTSIGKNIDDRVLTRADLYSVVDSATRVSVPRTTVNALAQLAPMLERTLGGEAAATVVLSAGEVGWLIEDKNLPSPRFIIPRPGIEAIVEMSVKSHGLVILVGATGVGKSLIARAVAIKRSGGFVIADFRDLNQAETRNRLDLLLGRIGAKGSRALILDDVEQLEVAGISLSLAQIAEALRRRDRIGLLTSNRQPSARALAELGLDAPAVIEIPYFSEAEAMKVVGATGGDAKKWGRLAYFAGAQGHPQLVHAFAMGMAARGWPSDAMREVVARGFTSEDVDAERDTARRALTGSLPAAARTLLYRLSLIIGRFDRALAIGIGSLPPAIPDAGEQLDELVGPWIETIGSGHYRVSPLASNAGREMLAADEQSNVDNFIATQLLARRTIDASDANIVLAHALLGKSTGSLLALAYCVMTTKKDLRGLLSEQFFMLRFLTTDKPIYPDDPRVSWMLRLAQFRLVAETQKGPDIFACVRALLNEATHERDVRMRTRWDSLALSTVLSTPGIADHLPNWIDLLVRLVTIVDARSQLRELKSNFERAGGSKGVSMYGSLFAIGATGISSVRRLEEVISALDALDAGKRTLFLREYDRNPDDYGILVNGPWLAEHKRNAIDPADAAARYKRMAEVTRQWGVRALALRCHVARAVMLDEYGNDKGAAISALDEGVVAFGEDIVLSRARAKVLWRHEDYSGAVRILRGIADRIGLDNPIERAFAMREAAISAANTNDWRLAEIWFADGQAAAAAVGSDDMQAMAIGLGADAAVAACKIGERGRALDRLANCLVALKGLDPEGSLKAAYCHRVFRHTILWTKAQMEGGETVIGGQPIPMLPGTCSNPDPLSAVRDTPLSDLDLAWYMLAEAEILCGADVGIAKTLYSKLARGPIAVLEVMMRNQWMVVAITDLDPVKFGKHLQDWLEGMAHMHASATELRATFDLVSPPREVVPPLGRDALRDEYLQAAAIDAILSFCMFAVFKGEVGTITILTTQLTDEFGSEFPGSALFKHWSGETTSLSPFDKVSADAIGLLRRGEHIEPSALYEIGLRLFERIDQSAFKSSLTPRIAEWLRAQWTRVVAEESFRLWRPMVTVPGINAALAKENNNASFVAALLLATSDAVRANLTTAYRNLLNGIMRGAKPTENLPGRSSNELGASNTSA